MQPFPLFLLLPLSPVTIIISFHYNYHRNRPAFAFILRCRTFVMKTFIDKAGFWQIAERRKPETSIPPNYSRLNKIRLVRGGKEYFDLLLQLIAGSQQSIHLQTYIFADDETGQTVITALIAAAKRNVQVHLMVDGYASADLGGSFRRKAEDAGIQFRFFEPLFRARHYYFGRRMHHKVFVSDGRVAIVGGMNIADRYNDFPEEPSWFDFAIAVEGEAASELCVLCWKSWNNFQSKMTITCCEKNLLPFEIGIKEPTAVRVRRNDWVRHKNEVSGSYIEMFRGARSHITIISSYFLPGRMIRRLLRHAVKRGVEVRVITAGPSDVLLAKRAERWMYDWLLRNKISLFEYQPTVLHAKAAVCDGEWLTLGSYNVNNISAYASIELNLDIRDETFAADFERRLEDVIKNDCIAITKDQHVRSKNIFTQFLRWCSYEFVRLAFYLLTFYFKQKRVLAARR